MVDSLTDVGLVALGVLIVLVGLVGLLLKK